MKPIFDLERYASLARQAAAEGAVLLRNEQHTLPLQAGSRIALFGRAQFHYYKSGTGSGGLVNTDHVTGIWEALSGPGGYQCDAEVRAVYDRWVANHPYEMGNGWAQEPWFQPEMSLEQELVQQAARRNDAAVILIGRTAGEDQDNADAPGSCRLTDEERKMLQLVCGAFSRSIVVLNVGNILDMSWVEEYRPGAVLYAWQGGQEGGLGVLDVLTGAVCPSGHLSDTIARRMSDYPAAENYGDDLRNFYKEDIYVGYRYFETFAPEKVLYPFGFGLSYTSFSRSLNFYDLTPKGLAVSAQVQNTGAVPGREVLQLYVQAPQGRLGKPARVLCAFGKTETLAPGASCEQKLFCSWKDLASYDDSGVTGHKSAWVLEGGEYRFYLGGDVRSAEPVFRLTLPETVVEQLEEAAAPTVPFERLRPGPQGEPCWEPVPLAEKDPERRREQNLQIAAPATGDRGLKLQDVVEGRAAMPEFLAQLTDAELCTLVRGEGMNSPRVTPGTAGAFGGVSAGLERYGLPAACCSDGPSGIRMDCGSIAFAMPNGTCLACTFDEALLEELYAMEGLELRKNQIDVLLGPGINLHRHPLNGRNFEYFSEDPLLTGRLAAAELRGMDRWGVMGCIKHFACNNQEHNRHVVESVVSERAQRELYLRGFEIALQNAENALVMTSYNPVNGFWTASNYDLVTTILRGQWGYQGLVMSDWWAECNDAGQPGDKQNLAAMVRAQNDLYMVVTVPEQNSHHDNLEQALAAGTLTRWELLRCAENICRVLVRTPAFRRQNGQKSQLDVQLEQYVQNQQDAGTAQAIPVRLEKSAKLDAAAIRNGIHETTLFCVSMPKSTPSRLELVCRAEPGNSPLAQIPLSIFAGGVFLKTVTLTGAQLDWTTLTVDIPAQPQAEIKPFYLKFYFGQGGMEIGSAVLTVVEEN